MNAKAGAAATGASSAIAALKMHGAHNTFVVIDERPPRGRDYPALARRACDPAGAFEGADGLLVIGDAPGYAASMRVYNADGSEAEMCGNGVRCVVRYLHDRGAGDALRIETLAGPIVANVVATEPAFAACVDIGPVRFPHDAEARMLDALGRTWTYYDASLGNPHAVVFVDDVEAIDLAALGAAFEADARFPHGTNVHVATQTGRSELRVWHYERGVGLTQACGTGAVACAAVALTVRGAASPVTVRVPGGTLRVDWTPGVNALLTGPAEPLATGTLRA